MLNSLTQASIVNTLIVYYAQLTELNIQKSLNTITIIYRESSTDKLIYRILNTFNSHLTFYVTATEG